MMTPIRLRREYKSLTRDAMRKHGLCCRPMSVRTYVRQTVEDIVKLFSRPGSHIILVF